MKRLVLLMLVFSLILLTSVCLADKSNIQIEVNGVNVNFVENDRVLHAIEENGVVYVPIGAFLDAINIPYEQKGYKIILSIKDQAAVESDSAEEQDSTDCFAQLSEDEQAMIGSLIIWANQNTSPSSLEIKKAFINEKMHRYLLYISYDDALKRTIESRIYISFGNAFIAPESYEDEELKKLDTDIEVLNGAYLQKCNDSAYIEGIVDAEKQKAINKQVKKVEAAEIKLKRWIDGGIKTESDIEKQREKVKKEKDILEELRKQYGIYD